MDMKKGEIKKQEFMRVAEIRFCRDGYDKTSIQDILDDLHSSKGSFYHHFISKEALLEEICMSRAASTAEQIFRSISSEMSTLEKLNILISGMIPLNGEKLRFLLMLIPVFSYPEGIKIRNCYANELEHFYLNPMEKVLSEGNSHQILACYDTAFCAKTLILLMNCFWMEICDKLLENEKHKQNCDAFVQNYRIAAERLLLAPYGSINIIQIPELQILSEQIHLHWKF